MAGCFSYHQPVLTTLDLISSTTNTLLRWWDEVKCLPKWNHKVVKVIHWNYIEQWVEQNHLFLVTFLIFLVSFWSHAVDWLSLSIFEQMLNVFLHWLIECRSVVVRSFSVPSLTASCSWAICIVVCSSQRDVEHLSAVSLRNRLSHKLDDRNEKCELLGTLGCGLVNHLGMQLQVWHPNYYNICHNTSCNKNAWVEVE